MYRLFQCLISACKGRGCSREELYAYNYTYVYVNVLGNAHARNFYGGRCGQHPSFLDHPSSSFLASTWLREVSCRLKLCSVIVTQGMSTQV